MPTIKGPIHFKKGFDASKFMKEKASEIKIKLPFEATGWKSSKTPTCADMSEVQTKTKEEPKVESKKVSLKDELIALDGIGEKTAKQILKLAKTKSELKKVSKKKLIDTLRDDVVEILVDFLGK